MSGAAASPAQPSPARRGVRRAPAPLLPSLRRRPGWVSVALAREVLAARPRVPWLPLPAGGRGRDAAPRAPAAFPAYGGRPVPSHGALPRPPQRDSARAACPRLEAQPGPGPSGLCPLRAAPPSAARPAAPGRCWRDPRCPSPAARAARPAVSQVLSARSAVAARAGPWRCRSSSAVGVSFLWCFIVPHNCSERGRWRLILRVVARCLMVAWILIETKTSDL